MLLIHDEIGVFWDFHEVTSYHLHILQWLKMRIHNLQWKTRLDSWMKQSNDNDALTDASFFVFSKTNPRFWVNQLCLAKLIVWGCCLNSHNFGRLVMSMIFKFTFGHTFGEKPLNTFLSFKRQKRTQFLKSENTEVSWNVPKSMRKMISSCDSSSIIF